MHASRAVCARCASRMHVAVGATAAPRFSSTVAADASSEATAGSPAGNNEQQQAATTTTTPTGQQRRETRRRQPPPFGAKGTGPGKRSSKPLSQQSAVALFNDVVGSRTPQASSTSRTMSPSSPEHQHQQHGKPAAPAASLGEWEIAAKMKELADRRLDDPRDRLRLFRADIWPHVRELRGQMPRHLYMATTQFLARACDAAAQEGHTAGGGGTALNLSAMCARIGKWDLDVRNELVLSLCHSLIHRKHSSAERAAILEELVDLWKHISQLRRKSQGHNAPLQFVLPTPVEAFGDAAGQQQQPPPQPQRSSNMNPTTKALSSIFIQFRLEQARELVPGMLATVAVLSDPRLARQGNQVKAAPLLNLISQAFQRQGNPDQPYIEEVFRNKIRFPSSKLDELEAYVLKQWLQAKTMLSTAAAPWRQALEGSKGSSSSSGLATFHRQLRAAYRARNTGAVVSIWQDLKARLAQKPDLARQMRDDPEFLDFWVFVWCAVRRPAKLQETLDLMRETGVQPTVKTYTAMMHGWKMCKDGGKIAALWDKLVESGMRLDAIIWTERISGLIESGRPQAGIQALAEMMALWKQALAKKGGDSDAAAATMAIRPNIEVVNAAFKGLVRLDLKAANEVLAWAGREGIEPNIRTYNILLRESFRGNASPDDDVQSLLRAMKRQGIEPDAATFTIILEEVLGVMDNTSAAEQVHAVQQVFADIEAAGLRANLETYGKMLYAVASLANGGADEAIAAVQEHMRAAGFSATPHMVTILIERAIARDASSSSSSPSSSSPSSSSSSSSSRATGSQAVQALLREHNLTHVGQGDQTLWERVMSAHAAAGDTQSAMRVFGDLAAAGRPVTSLPCLTDLLRALLAAAADDERRVDDAHEVVRVVLAHKVRRAATETPSSAAVAASGAVGAAGATGAATAEGAGVGEGGGGRDARYWRHHFWYMARENGLLNWDEVPADLQARLRGHGELGERRHA
ncbi:glutathione S-transferase [Purpureocillium lavendulum]|uniref:Glutathione S-transferase n=1 Tax=Purpureocillium lavendulum TaxID=1247861 RepID=A0AB34FR12_9HYPO|nr:glutathione S-transferase [Purpureocillium lavendulum]